MVMKILWIVCAVIWAAVILGFVSLVAFNRWRNRKRKED